MTAEIVRQGSSFSRVRVTQGSKSEVLTVVRMANDEATKNRAKLLVKQFSKR